MINVPKIRLDLDKAISDHKEILNLLKTLSPDNIEYNVALARKDLLEARIAMLKEWLRG